MRVIVFGLAMLATAAGAMPVGPSEFAAIAAGRTLHFELGGTYYGSEQYLGDGTVVWRAADGTCERGRWFGSGDEICFVYENAPESPKCWEFTQEDGAIRARATDWPQGLKLLLSGSNVAPLACETQWLGS